jgi:UDP-N-acetyl-D-glucosamine dehydrogenase
VVLESMVYPGIIEEILQPILVKSGFKAGKDFGLAYCPERYNPGMSNIP